MVSGVFEAHDRAYRADCRVSEAMTGFRGFREGSLQGL